MIQVDVADCMEIMHPKANAAFRFIFQQVVQKYPSLYGFLFQQTRNRNALYDLIIPMNRFAVKRLHSLIVEKSPSTIVSTFPLAAGAVAALKKSGLVHIPDVTVITDHTDHMFWVHPSTDHYLVGSENVKQGLLKYGVDDQQCTVTGIPVRTEFTRSYNRQMLASSLNLNPSLQTILVMGGGAGMMGDSAGLLKRLNCLPEHVQILFVCGHNRKLQLRLEREALDSKYAIRIFGYVNRIHELMAVSDMIVTKPGGVTTSEALAMNLPLVLFKAIPGQEEDNANYLLQLGAAVEADSVQEIVQRIAELIQSPGRLHAMRSRAAAAQRKQAAEAAAHRIMKACRTYKTADDTIETWSPNWQA